MRKPRRGHVSGARVRQASSAGQASSSTFELSSSFDSSGNSDAEGARQLGDALKGTRPIEGLPFRSSEEHLPTRGDLVNVCVTVSESLHAHSRLIHEAWTNGWPKVKKANVTRKKRREGAPAAGAGSAGSAGHADGGDGLGGEQVGGLGAGLRPPLGVDGVESETESLSVEELVARPSTSMALVVSGRAGQGERGWGQEGQALPESTPVLELMESLEAYVFQRLRALADRGSPLARERQREVKREIQRVATDVLPKLLLQLFIKMDELPRVSTSRLRPWQFDKFDRRIGKYESLLLGVAENIGLDKDVVRRAVAKLKLKVDRVAAGGAASGEAMPPPTPRQQRGEEPD